MLLTPHLAQLPLLCGLVPDELKKIVSHTRILELDKDQIIFHCGDKPDGIFYVLNGQVKLSITAPSGAEKVIDLVGPQRSFGEALLFLEIPSPVTAQALQKTVAARIPRDIILNSIETSPEFTKHLLAGLSHRMHHLISDLEALCLQTSVQRTIGYILSEANKVHTENQYVQILLPANKNIIASWLNLTPETFSRTLHHLEENKLLKVTGKQIDILNLEKLKGYR